MMVEITERAKKKGFTQVEMLCPIDMGDYVVCALYERREVNKVESYVSEWLDPTIIFKTPVLHKEYDKALSLMKKMGSKILFAEAIKIQTDYYGLEFDGSKVFVRSWGYTSNHLPVGLRWNRQKIEETAKEWVPSFAADVELLYDIIRMVKAGKSDMEIEAVISRWLYEIKAEKR